METSSNGRQPRLRPATTDQMLTSSARGASILVLLQVGSRVLTFLVNQILLRFLSPELLGISAQLELYLITVLYFSRESIRVALQRQGDGPANASREKKDEVLHGKVTQPTSLESAAGQSQSVVNLAWLSVLLGPFSALAFGAIYTFSLSTEALFAIPDLLSSILLYTIAAMVELLSEPSFVIVQQKSLYRYRAAAETIASLLRCGVSCGIVIYLSRSDQVVGSSPFAYGQLAYAITLLVIYYFNVSTVATYHSFALTPRPLSSSQPQNLVAGFFYRPLLSLASSMYLQSGIKHLLTQGDSLLVATLCSLQDQGVYSLASNYGGLIARVLFQPIEESCRNHFGKLLHTPELPATKMDDDEETSILEQERKERRQLQLQSAKMLLLDILHSYAIISVLTSVFGPTFFPMAVKLLVGSRWSSPAAISVLSSYIYYIPLLAINGVTEAFVASVATPADLQRQSVAMVGFSAGFAAAGWFFLSFLDLGAEGLVWANVLSMALRIGWSVRYIQSWFKREGSSFSFMDATPKIMTMTGAILGSSALSTFRPGEDLSMRGVSRSAGLVAVLTFFIVFTEQAFLADLARRRMNEPKDDKPPEGRRSVIPLPGLIPMKTE